MKKDDGMKKDTMGKDTMKKDDGMAQGQDVQRRHEEIGTAPRPGSCIRGPGRAVYSSRAYD